MPEDLKTFSDESLIQLYKKHTDTKYIGELYKRYSLLIYGLCYKYFKNAEDAKDCLTEIFELVIKKAQTQEITFFKAWIYTVSRNYLLRKLERQKPIENVETEFFSEIFMENEDDRSLYNKEKNLDLLQQALSNLTDVQRTCIELFYYKQKSYQEVASITGYDLNKVKSAIQNGKRNLKLFMEENKNQNG
ncbi:MAG: sigma-70 family RNA polymerase sigma factor [Chitinophagales bacterium]